MNNITRKPVAELGSDFIPAQFLPNGKDEFYLRNSQNPDIKRYRNLNAHEIEVLVRNRNTCTDWNQLLVSDAFNPELVKNCKFFGLVRIGKLEALYLEFNDLKLPVGLYNSVIINCDLGDNAVIDNVNYLAYYIIGNEVIIANVHEMLTTNHAKFGHGILKEGETEAKRVWLEICNENGGRAILPFDGMLAGDAWLWTRDRHNADLQRRFREMTEKTLDNLLGYYGTVGDRTVIKNCSIIKDVKIGSDAYLKGANKLKNLTINSMPDSQTQIGEGCELVNGIIGNGCRIFYGVKAVRFVMGANSQLKYGARLINSFLGENSTISCCEVLNSLLFPGHEQHHNNSFLIAAAIGGQSNIAAGATLGSNHNSRAADGELMTGRGFWPGLCTSLKYNSKFAPFTILTKADYQYELNNPFPFALISNDPAGNQLQIMPAYWLMYNQYALERNSAKYGQRDKRTEKTQHLETAYLAPDSVNAMFEAIDELEMQAGLYWLGTEGNAIKNKDEIRLAGRNFLNSEEGRSATITVSPSPYENSKRATAIIHAADAYRSYTEHIKFYAAGELIRNTVIAGTLPVDDAQRMLSVTASRAAFENIGGQLIPATKVESLKSSILNYEIISWKQVHEFYVRQSEKYGSQKLTHAIASLQEILRLTGQAMPGLKELFEWYLAFKAGLVKKTYDSRGKDYRSSFRKMLYSSEKEMEAVLGKLEKTPFLKEQKESFAAEKKHIEDFLQKLV